MYYILLLFGLYEILKYNMKFHKYSQCFVEGRDPCWEMCTYVFYYFLLLHILVNHTTCTHVYKSYFVINNKKIPYFNFYIEKLEIMIDRKVMISILN